MNYNCIIIKMESLLIQDLDSSNTLNFNKNNNNWINIYQYYYFGGYKYIYTNNIVKLLISYVLIIVINFLINCVNYRKILNLSDKEHNIGEFIDLNNWFPKNIYLLLCFTIYCIYLLCITINCIFTLIKFKKIQKLMNEFYEINDNRIKFLNWENIVEIIIEKNKENYHLLNSVEHNLKNEHEMQYNLNEKLLNQNELNDMENGNNNDNNNIIDINMYDENIYIVNSILCKQSNIIISVFRSRLFTIPRISKLLEWNFIYCIIEPLLSISNINNNSINNSILEKLSYLNLSDLNISRILNKYKKKNEHSINEQINESNNNIENNYDLEINEINEINDINNHNSNSYLGRNLDKENQNENLENQNKDENNENNFFLNDINRINYLKKVNRRINLVLFINIISLPFAIIILGIYIILKYGEKFYHNPKLVYDRQIDLRTKWLFKYYNETPDMYDDRMKKIQKNMKIIINQYKHSVFQIIYRLFIFILGSIFIILFVLTIIGGNEFANVILFDNKSIIWFLSIIGTLLLLMRSNNEDKSLTKKEKNEIINELREDLITINQKMIEHDDKEYFINLLKHIYPYKIIFIWYEIYYLIISFYYLLLWKKEVNKNCNKLFELIEYNYIVGNVSKYSIFENINELESNMHMLLSYKEFTKNYNFKFNK